MSSCNKNLYHYDVVKNCTKCGNVKLKSNFHKKKNMSDGLDPRCRVCWKQYYLDYRDMVKLSYFNIRDRIRENCLQNQDRMKEYKLKNHDKIRAQKRIDSNDK